MSLLAGYSEEDKLAGVERRVDLNGHLATRRKVLIAGQPVPWGHHVEIRGFSMYCRTARDTIFEENNIFLQPNRIFVVPMK